MNLFNRKNDTKTVSNDKRASLEAFKAKANGAVLTDSIEKITGGALSGCHTGKLA